RAVCIFAVEQIALLRIEGHRVAAGSLGENIAIEGVDWSEVTPGVRIQFGDDVLVEVTDYASPCWKNAQWFIDGNFNRISQETHPGSSRVYARVLQTGTIHEGDPVVVMNGDAIDRVWRRQPIAVRWPRDFR
ncbi:MAG TPA: MOSC domain-containing protein, partial [Candidatus Binataceae bacterium]|nr:MOSC domain-containing protein [Candidatus Binataceae bacterium]